MMVSRKLRKDGSELGKKKPLLLVCENVSSTNPSNFKGLAEVFGEF